MRRSPSALWFALLLATPATAQTIGDTTLANGLHVFVSENHRVPAATVVIAVRTGAFTQEANEDGLAHLYEHLLYRAYPHGLQGFIHDASKIEAAFNGGTSVDYVAYFLDLPADHLPDAVHLLNHLVRNAHFTQSEVDAERPIVYDEMARDNNSPQAMLQREVLQRLWGASWSHMDAIGDSATIGGLTLAEVQSQYTRFYVPNNAAVFVSGDVSTSVVRKVVADAFGDWAPGPDPVVKPTHVALDKTTFVLVPGPVVDVTYLIALQGPPNGPADSDAVPAGVLAGVLNSPAAAFQGRLVGNGTFTSVTCSYRGDRFDGTIEFRAQTDLAHAQKALLTLLNEMDVMDALQDVSDTDLVFARRASQVGTAIAAQDPHGLALFLPSWWGGPGLADYEAEDQREAAVRFADLTHVAATYIAGRPLVVGILAPPAAIAIFRRWLAAPPSGGQK